MADTDVLKKPKLPEPWRTFAAVLLSAALASAGTAGVTVGNPAAEAERRLTRVETKVDLLMTAFGVKYTGDEKGR